MKIKMRKLEKTMMKRFWNETDEQEALERLKIDAKRKKLRKANKIEGHERNRINKRHNKIETEDIMIERINKLNKIEKIKALIK